MGIQNETNKERITRFFASALILSIIVGAPPTLSAHFKGIEARESAEGVKAAFSNLGLKDSQTDFTTDEFNTFFVDSTLDIDGLELTENETFSLNSRPDAPITFYLDFNGANLVNTRWNSSSNKETLVYPAWSMNATTDFNTTELGIIYLTWAKISETFKQFNVNVTTQLPDVNAIVKIDESDDRYGIHAIFTQGPLDGLEDCECRGIALLGTFGEPDYLSTHAPVFINPEIGNLETRHFNTSELVAGVLSHIAIHEVGHALGLEHHGISGEHEYAPPIGFLSFYLGSTPSYSTYKRWSNGSAIAEANERNYNVLTNEKDDLAHLTSILPLAITSDDYPNTVSEAIDGNVVSIINEGSIDGFASTHDDIDVVVLSVDTPGVYRIAGAPAIHNHQLALQLELYDFTGDLKENIVKNDLDRLLIIRMTGDYSQEEIYTYLTPGNYIVKLSPYDGNYIEEEQSKSAYGSIGSWTLNLSGYELSEEDRRLYPDSRAAYGELSGGKYWVSYGP